MADKNKIRIMVDLAIYEKHHEKDVFKINHYYKSDYIFWSTLQICIRYVVMFLLCLVLYIIVSVDTLFYNINLNGLFPIFSRIGIYFFVGFIFFLLISLIVYSYRYDKAKKGMYFYASKLKRLARKYHYIDAANIK